MWGRDVVRLFRARWGLGRVLSDLVSKYTLSRFCFGESVKFEKRWLGSVADISMLRRGCLIRLRSCGEALSKGERTVLTLRPRAGLHMEMSDVKRMEAFCGVLLRLP